MRDYKISKELPYWFLMFVLLCLSGNPLFSYESRITAQAFGIIILITGVARREHFVTIIKYISLFLFIFLAQSIIVSGFSITSTGFVVMKMIIGVAIACIIGERFTDCYIDVMWILSIISLVGYGLTITIGLLPGIPCAVEGVSQIIYTQLYGYEILNRNCGMFWEPGAFAGYLNLALVFMVLNNRLSKILVLPMLAALSTTYSTTGYLVFFVILIYYLHQNGKMSSTRKVILIALSLIAIYYVYNSLDFLGDKINTNDEVSNSRITNYTTYSKNIMDNFLFGSSFTENTISSGNGFLSFLMDVGAIGLVYYFILLYRKCTFIFKKSEALFFVVVLVIMLQGECFLNYPLFMALPCVLYSRVYQQSMIKKNVNSIYFKCSP